VGPKDGLDRAGVRRAGRWPDAPGNPGRLGSQLVIVDVDLAAPGVHVHGRDDAAAGHQADDQQPPLELGHQAGSSAPAGAFAGRSVFSTAASLPAAAYTPPSD
jgi:hypothetical protein